MVEQLAVNQRVAGSSPASGANFPLAKQPPSRTKILEEVRFAPKTTKNVPLMAKKRIEEKIKQPDKTEANPNNLFQTKRENPAQNPPSTAKTILPKNEQPANPATCPTNQQNFSPQPQGKTSCPSQNSAANSHTITNRTSLQNQSPPSTISHQANHHTTHNHHLAIYNLKTEKSSPFFLCKVIAR